METVRINDLLNQLSFRPFLPIQHNENHARQRCKGVFPMGFAMPIRGKIAGAMPFARAYDSDQSGGISQ
jgi:hypothetical protein